MTKSKKYSAIGAILALIIAAVVGFTITNASAHTPSSSASCDGVVVSGSNYGQEATLNISIQGGSSDNKNFTGSGSLTVPVPQDGVAHTYTASVTSTHGENSESYSGSVGPCGTPPPVDVCDNIPGDQPEGTDCNPVTPPVDVCDDIEGNQPEGTDCNPAVTPKPKPTKHKTVGSLPNTGG